MPAAAFGVETGGQRDGFQQGGFSAAVFAYQKSDRALQLQGVQTLDQRQICHIIFQPLRIVLQPDLADVKVEGI